MADTLQQRLDFVGLGEGVETRLAPIATSVAHHLEVALQRFNAQIATTPSAARFLYGRERIEGQNGGPSAHWHALVTGRLDAGFAEAATKAGQQHARIGVEPRWHAGSHAIIAETLIKGVIQDGIAAALRQRRGPLGLLAADPAPVLEATEVMAEGLATLMGAIVLDLDLTFSGYADKLRQEAQAALEAQQARLRQAVEQAGAVLELAAEGVRDEALMSQQDPELAPLRAGAEKLADRVIGLLTDLDLSGEAVRTLATDVLASGRVLVEDRSAELAQAGALAGELAGHETIAGAMATALGELNRQVKTSARRCSKARRALDGVRAVVDTVRRDATQHGQGGASEKADALSYAANLLAARLAADAGPGSENNALDQDMRALALGLAQLAGQLRAGQDRSARALDDAGAALEGAVVLLYRLGEDMGASLRSTTGLERDGQRQVTEARAARAAAEALEQLLQAGLERSATARQSLMQTIEGAASLVELAGVMGGEGAKDAAANAGGQYPAPDHAALAAHWHVL